ncbi:hypothetical protein C8R43DRAFT_957317 [Mycena crocata]|nr:hypothetical protein C8R43DRAFT_957317 [Mycena crocata]
MSATSTMDSTISLENTSAASRTRSEWFDLGDTERNARAPFWKRTQTFLVATFWWLADQLKQIWLKSWGYQLLQTIHENPFESLLGAAILLVFSTLVTIIVWRLRLEERDGYGYPIVPGPSYPAQTQQPPIPGQAQDWP